MLKKIASLTTGILLTLTLSSCSILSTDPLKDIQTDVVSTICDASEKTAITGKDITKINSLVQKLNNFTGDSPIVSLLSEQFTILAADWELLEDQPLAPEHTEALKDLCYTISEVFNANQ